MEQQLFDTLKTYQSKLWELHEKMQHFMSEDQSLELLEDLFNIHDYTLETENYINPKNYVGIMTQTIQPYYEIPAQYPMQIIYIYNNHYVLAEDLQGKQYYIPMELLEDFQPLAKQLAYI